MVAMKMGNENTGHYCRRHIRKDELPLSSFSWVEQKTLIIPNDEISTVIPLSGRLLAGTA